MNTKDKRMLVMALMIVSVLILFGAISYAYFTTQTEERKQQADLNTATLALRFADNDNGVKAEMKFGETVTKKFLIENTGTAEASLSIDWYNLVNTYMDGSLTYSLAYSETEDGEYEEIRPKSNIPVSEEMIHQTLEGEVSVPAGKTYYYNLAMIEVGLDEHLLAGAVMKTEHMDQNHMLHMVLQHVLVRGQQKLLTQRLNAHKRTMLSP